jgi:hypothetical protein
MSASDNNNRKGINNMEQKESEVEAAIGRADVRGGDSPREGGLPATGTQDFETAQSEGDVVATQLDGLAREQEENEGSSMEESGPPSEGSGSLPGMQGIFMKQSAQELEMATAVKGGVQQGRKPSWSFTGKLSVPYGNKRGPNKRGPSCRGQGNGGSANVWIPHDGDPVGRGR